jgi:hypothetical protein
VYLERTLLETAPRPYGVAPAALIGDAVVAAVAPGEAVWLGFQALDRPVEVQIRGEEPLLCPPATRLDRLFEAGDHVTLLAPAPVEIRLVAPAEFERVTGERPAPLDPGTAYKGQRLP